MEMTSMISGKSVIFAYNKCPKRKNIEKNLQTTKNKNQ